MDCADQAAMGDGASGINQVTDHRSDESKNTACHSKPVVMGEVSTLCTVPELKKVIRDLEPKNSKRITLGVRPGMMMTPLTMARADAIAPIYTPDNYYDEVYPKLLLGDHVFASDKEKLKLIGVTHVVNCAEGNKFCQINTSEDFFSGSDIKYHGINAMDVPKFRLIDYFRPAADFIEDGLLQEGKVFVHCYQGISRSAAMVIAFLMLKKDMPVAAALAEIRAKRAVQPNEGFLKQLCQLNAELFAPTQALEPTGL